MRNLTPLFLILILMRCAPDGKNADKPVPPGGTLFSRLQSSETGIAFSNNVEPGEDFDVFRYRNFYNGGGVGIGDLNNDGLADVFLTSNMGDNKLYLNKGNWKFEDITERAGVKGEMVWSTGVSIADVNADGFLDIYVCNAGDVKGARRENELFINNGDLTFTNQAREYGLADNGFTTHAAFFDYDKDGDLDCFILNNSPRPISSLGYRNLRHVRDETGGHKLMQNNNGKFTDVSEKAGIFGSVIGFGLGITIGDVNQDLWPDLYISNDFYELDYLYINNQKGGFEERVDKHMGHISMFSMGADVADLNNDGFPEIFSTDMLPEDDYRLKTLIAFETYDVAMLRLKNGYYHQYMRNMLQLNNGDGTYSEIGNLAGVAATDWSWGALIADLNNDRNKDILVCNGIYKDVIDQDFVEFLSSNEEINNVLEGNRPDFKKFIDRMPSNKLSNYLYSRDSELTYKNVSREWGLDEPSFSNGAAYGDLDNDGDLDLIVSNVNMEAFVYRNNSREKEKNNFLALTFKGDDKNVNGLGAQVKAFVNGEILSFDHMPIRGFQSSMDYKMIIGLGMADRVDSLVVTWPDGKRQILKNVTSNQALLLDVREAAPMRRDFSVANQPLLTKAPSGQIKHVENPYNDFDRDRLQYHMLSTQGPAFAKADLNKDGQDDIFIGGSPGESSKLYLQKDALKFFETNQSVFGAEKNSEAVAAAFFDSDNDGDLDLYVVTGGSETSLQSRNSTDQLYINKGLKNGSPVFEKSEGKIPALYQAGSCVKPADVDHDGDVDLFVGNRVTPLYYGIPCDQVLLLNDGKGNFTDATASVAPEFKKLGMVTDAVWFDDDKDGFSDLLIVGEWMKITFFKNTNGKLKKTEISGLQDTEGWWNRISAADLDGDGDTDFVIGNHGLNSKFKPAPETPVLLYVNDFDQNGSVEPIYAYPKNGKEYPMALRQDLVRQMSSLKKKILYFKDYATKTLPEIFSADLLQRAERLSFKEPRTSVLLNNGTNGFERRDLPVYAQFSPVYGIDFFDVDKDGDPDVLLGGNLFATKPEVGRYDAMHGLILRNDGKANFTPLSLLESGLNVPGEIRHIATIRSKGRSAIAFVRNNDSIIFYKGK